MKGLRAKVKNPPVTLALKARLTPKPSPRRPLFCPFRPHTP
jgi:hypothetical protein